MEDFSINGAEQINIRDRFIAPKVYVPKVDEVISKIVGRPVYAQDPKLVKLIVGWRKSKPLDSLEPDNFLKDPEKVKQLIEIFNQ
jgi:hypothetical protein